MISNVGCIQRLCKSWVKLIHGAHVVYMLETFSEAVRESACELFSQLSIQCLSARHPSNAHSLKSAWTC